MASPPSAAVGPGSSVAYDDAQIAKIKAGQTAEPQLLEWFGPPVSHDVSPNGRSRLTWSMGSALPGSVSLAGRLSVSLSPAGKVEAYSARRLPLEQSRTVEFVERSEADMREHMEQWRRDGWSVQSVSAQLAQPDGTTKRRAELSRTGDAAGSGVSYDDHLVATIRRADTTEPELLEKFGPADSRDLQPDGRMRLAWRFADAPTADSDGSGQLNVILAADGKVESYGARQGPQ